ncbi:MAG: TIGR01212 family radical SAM protein [Clostridia bacterium]|nr:TIGR01212 family radical SAM protein [Clostridia bacterium]
MYYYSLNNYLKERFGEKVYKISLDGGMTCPNRDGKIGYGGCVFCSNGSGQFTAKGLTIFEQIENGKNLIKQKTSCSKFIAYFQSYTNTYAPTEYLKNIFTQAINHPDIVAISIGTRPDCLPEDVIELLAVLNKIKPVWVELGLQTSNEKTAAYINRGYSNEIYSDAVCKLKENGIYVVTHMIIGLPGEYYEDFLYTLRYICRSGSDGIKLQLLHVLKGTKLAEDFLSGKFRCLEKDEYIDIVCKLIRHIPKNIVIHRITGDGDKKLTIAPQWSLNKKDVLNSFNKMIKIMNITQGDAI